MSLGANANDGVVAEEHRLLVERAVVADARAAALESFEQPHSGEEVRTRRLHRELLEQVHRIVRSPYRGTHAYSRRDGASWMVSWLKELMLTRRAKTSFKASPNSTASPTAEKIRLVEHDDRLRAGDGRAAEQPHHLAALHLANASIHRPFNRPCWGFERSAKLYTSSRRRRLAAS